MTSQGLPRANLPDMLGFIARVFLPTIGKGVIIRRPGIVGLAQRFNLDRRAVRYMQKMRAKYGAGPLIIPLPLQHQAVILAPQDVHHVLDNSAEPFAVSTFLKRAALSHFEPQNVLLSHGEARDQRREFHEDVLDFHRPAHRLAEGFIATVNAEAASLVETARQQGELAWKPFLETWYRIVRVVVFGDAARDDHELTNMLGKLRRNANWAFARPHQKALRERFLARVQARLAESASGSLAAVIAHRPTSADTALSHQVPQWLFAFDPAGMTVFRALAVLATHPGQQQTARQEIEADQTNRQHLPFLRACVLETLRLWPTTPMILRESTRETAWEHGRMPARTGILIFAPFFHRDDEQLSYADRFTPSLWLENDGSTSWPLVPFSGGPATCPGRQLVLLLTSAMLAALLDQHQVQLQPSIRLDPDKPLPATLNNYALRFQIQ